MKINVMSRHKKLPRSDVYKGLSIAMKEIGIRQYIKEMSLVGRSVVELYHEDKVTDIVRSKLKELEILLSDFDIMKQTDLSGKNFDMNRGVALKRIGTLLKRNQGKKFRECILSGFDDKFVQEAYASILEDNRDVKDLEPVINA
jgi:hypothetical protein